MHTDLSQWECKDPNANGLVNTVLNEGAKTRQSVVRRHRTEKSQNKTCRRSDPRDFSLGRLRGTGLTGNGSRAPRKKQKLSASPGETRQGTKTELNDKQEITFNA